jgi:hypothetical protein
MRFLVPACLLSACATGEATSHTIDTLPSGAILVTNRAPSAWTDTTTVRLVLERVIAPGEGTPGELARPSDLGIAADGRIAVADGSGSGVLVFGPDGSFERTIGRAGEGPGEYSWFFALDARGDTVAVGDCNHARVILYEFDGALLAQWTTEGCSGSYGIELDLDGPWLGGRLAQPEGGLPVLFRWSADGTIRDTFVLPPAPQPDVWVNAAGAAVPIPFSAWPVNTGRPSAWWEGIGDSARLIHRTPDGTAALESVLPLVREPIPDSVRHASIAGLLQSPRFGDVVKLADVPTIQPVFTALQVDETGRVWLSRPDANGVTASFEVVDPAGRWLGTVAAPPGGGTRPIWRRDRMYRISETADGLPSVEIYRVEGMP